MGGLMIILMLLLSHQAGFINAGGYGISGAWGMPLGLLAGLIGGLIAIELDN